MPILALSVPHAHTIFQETGIRLRAVGCREVVGYPAPPPCEKNAFVRTSVGVSATFGTMSYFALRKFWDFGVVLARVLHEPWECSWRIGSCGFDVAACFWGCRCAPFRLVL